MNVKKTIIYSLIIIIISIFFISLKDVNILQRSIAKGIITMTIKNENNENISKGVITLSIKDKKEYSIITKNLAKTIFEDTNPVTLVHIKIPTYNQATTGYTLGCEGVSLFMALKGLGYIKDYDINKFMKTMPKGKTPFEGYMGNPKIGHYGENKGKRTTIYPEPLANWASNYATGKNLTGATVDDLKRELDQGHVVLVYVTSGWQKPQWKKYSWSINPKGEIENNHCLTIVGYKSNGDILVNDCHDGRTDGRQGEYWVKASKFESIYNLRNYAVSVY